MDALDHQTRALSTLPPDERLAAIASVFATAPLEEREQLGPLLVELACKPSPEKGLRLGRRGVAVRRGVRECAVLLLACHWREVPPGLRQVALAAGRGCWSGAVGGLPLLELSDRGNSVAELSLDSCDPGLTRHLPSILEHGSARGVAMAGQALLGLALRLAEQTDRTLLGIDPAVPALRPVLDGEASPWTAQDVQGLLAAVAAGVEMFEHHKRKEVLLAALVLLESPRQGVGGADALADLAADRESSAGRTLRSAFRRARAPIARHRAWLWLREESVAAACTERIARAPTVVDHEVLLASGHLALAPARGRYAGIVPIATRPAPRGDTPPGLATGQRLHPEGPVPDRQQLAALSPAARRNVPRLIESLDADEATRMLALDPFLVEPDPVARFNAARVARGEDAKGFCFDSEEAIARHAATRVTAVGVAESGRLRSGDDQRRRFAASLKRSSHRSVRQIGEDEYARLDPGGGGVLRLIAARRAHAADPASFADWVRERLATGDPGETVGTLMVCRRIRAIAAVESIVLGIIHDSMAGAGSGEARVAATAVACLGDLRSPRSESVLRECFMRHADDRVRANAAEALGRARPTREGVAAFAEISTDQHHRVRASVLRALLVPWPEPKPRVSADAVESLSSMLTDSRPAHRLAGVWVVQRSLVAGLGGGIGRRWDRLAGRVRWLADEDTDPGVRARAVVVTNRLDAAIAGLGPRSAGGAVV